MNPLPEDPERPYPTYQMDSFDATSYVETVIAMSIAETFADFEILMNRLRYKNGDIGFMARNHFIGADWIPENTRQGLIRDITELIVSGLKPREKCLQLLMTPIDREEWFRRKFSIEIKAPVYISRLQYIPRKVIMTMPLEMARIPSATVANFVRDGRHMRKIVGTEIDVSHQGILIRKGDGRLYLRHASSLHRRVVEEDFYDFLESQKQLLGVNFQQVLMPERGR